MIGKTRLHRWRHSQRLVVRQNQVLAYDFVERSVWLCQNRYSEVVQRR